MTLLLLRHGNTFEAGALPTWVGARTDMPLTAEGEAQARAAATYLVKHNPPVTEIVAGPLQRTRRMAEIIGETLKLSPRTDDRLREIDYGLWEGKSHAEIVQQHGSSALEAWEQRGIWPEDMNWSPTLEILRQSISAFLDEARALHTEGQTRLAVTSNGILRIVHALVTGEPAGPAAKVRTGRLCVLTLENAAWKITKWNAAP